MNALHQFPLTVSQLARESKIPRASVLYYLKQFGEYFPLKHDVNGRKRLGLQAIDIAKQIRTLYDKKYSKDYIVKSLQHFGNCNQTLSEVTSEQLVLDRVIAVENRVNSLEKRIRERSSWLPFRVRK